MFADAHCHSNPVYGIGARNLARKFRKSGGWFIALLNLPPWGYGLSGQSHEDYIKSVEIILNECNEARQQGLKVACLAGFHPAIIDRLANNGMPLTLIRKIAVNTIDYIVALCVKNKINGIGEVGRPHYKTMPERIVLADEILRYALMQAKDHDCIVHMHLENAGEYTIENVYRIMMEYNDPKPYRRIFHHSTVNMAIHAIKRGLTTTLPGREGVLKRIIDHKVQPYYMIESDFIDDPRRPGVVVYPWKLPEIQFSLLNRSLVSEDYLYTINVDMIKKIYEVHEP